MTNPKFFYQAATDDTVDPEWELRHADGKPSLIAIQDSRSYGGGFAVNEYGKRHEWMRIVSTHRSLAAAKKAALAVYSKRYGLPC